MAGLGIEKCRIQASFGEAARFSLARPEGLEPPTARFEAWCSIRLSYGRTDLDYRKSRDDRVAENPILGGYPGKPLDKEINAIVERIEAFRTSDHQSLRLICKTRRQATKLHKALEKRVGDIHLLDMQSPAFPAAW